MTRVIFLLLERVTSERDYWQWLCRWLEQRYLKGERALVLLADDQRLSELDRLLWVFSDCSLVPHTPCNITDWRVCDYPIALVKGDDLDFSNLDHHVEWLVNCSGRSLQVAGSGAVDRLVELVPAMSDIKKRMRAVYKEYTSQGVEPITEPGII